MKLRLLWRRAVKAVAMRFAGLGRWGAVRLGRTRINYAADVGDGTGNSIVMACVLWFCRAFPEAPLVVRQITRDGPRAIEDHPMIELLHRPNPHYGGILLWMATTLEWLVTGNAYWIKVRSSEGRPVQLWWVPAALIEPRWPADGSAFISHYRYTPMGVPIDVPPQDVVHFRYGMDPRNPRRGLSPLASLLREIFTDDEAANFTAVLLRNLGVPGVILTPDDEQGLAEDEAKAIKESYEQNFGDDQRGRAMVTLGRMRVTVVGYNPQQMDLAMLRRIPEERVSAVLGIPAIVVGLGAGLARSTFSNYAEAREAAYESNIIPSQRLLADELDTQLLPEWGDTRRLRTGFDNSGVRVLQDDQNKLYARLNIGYQGGWLKRSEVRLAVGREVGPEDDVYRNEVVPAPALLPLPTNRHVEYSGRNGRPVIEAADDIEPLRGHS